jgi:hypothetical protein
MGSIVAQPPRRFVEYDALQRRLWIFGQRCHHGAGGTLVAALAAVGLIVDRRRGPSRIALVAAAFALMAHDWKDKSIWFERGRGTQA